MTLTNKTFEFETLQALFDASKESWTGCDWSTSFGARNLNLKGFRSHKTRLLAEATSGEEAQEWETATDYLSQVESDAALARSAAESAIHLIHIGNIQAAQAVITRAVAIESKYRTPRVWSPLQAVIDGQ